ncbi:MULTISPECIES: hypothetical protein [unclassified Dysgonomonas]|uniref:hypothetical protein n=1 Tax=unclassified Dysgonomonas TaxID=2630389 RepID=UPI0025B7FDA1|nr:MULTISPECIES: hypothetical protein [unclassified Dysgonomonas]
MAYNIKELTELKEYFREVFGVGIGQFIDTLMTSACAKIMIDIVKFDEYLHKTHPDDSDLSCDEIIFKYYGDEAAALIDELI